MKKLILMGVLLALVAVEGHAQEGKKSVRKYKVEERVSPASPEKKVIRIEKNTDGQVTEAPLKAPRARTYIFQSDDVLTGDTLPERELRYGEDFSWEEEFPRLSEHYRRNLGSLKLNMERFGDKINRDFQWETSMEGFTQVSVFTNKPATHILNLRFKSSGEGPVTIAVVDHAGERIARDEVKDFSGEYMGQLHLKEGSKGTFFVIISQGERAVSRRVKVGE